MRTLYLECKMGAAGDMLMAALWELLPPAEQADFLAQMNALGLPGVRVEAQSAEKCGIRGTHMAVTVNGAEEGESPAPHGQGHPHSHGAEQTALTAPCPGEVQHAHGHPHPHGGHHHHAGLADIRCLIGALPVPETVRENAQAVYDRLAEAESAAHGRPVEQIHFHEVGTADAVADIVGVCWLLARLAPDQIVASPVQVGGGTVRCAHGVLPVPAPATAWLLRGVPSCGGAAQSELCTPTGAALLTHFADAYGPQPAMTVAQVGCGLGRKDFGQANCLRAFWGESGAGDGDEVWELRCNLDDMTPEAVAFAAEELLAGGALDVFTTAIGMKKGRPGVLLTCLCRPENRQAMLGLLFRHTTTLGVRQTLCPRAVLRRGERVEQTARGPVRVKTAEGWGVQREKPEYEDLARQARDAGLPLKEVQP